MSPLPAVSLADLSAPLWFLGCWFGCTLYADTLRGWLVLVLYRRECRSRLLRTLGMPVQPGG